MQALCVSLREKKVLHLLIICGVALTTSGMSAAHQLRDAQGGPQPERSSAPQFEKSIFQRPMPGAQLAFLDGLAGLPTGKAIRNKKFHKLLHEVVPDCVFHYGWDMSLFDALELVLKGCPCPFKFDRVDM
jgi:hypothetical protein